LTLGASDVLLRQLLPLHPLEKAGKVVLAARANIEPQAISIIHPPDRIQIDKPPPRHLADMLSAMGAPCAIFHRSRHARKIIAVHPDQLVIPYYLVTLRT
jgi:hypothetical protein